MPKIEFAYNTYTYSHDNYLITQMWQMFQYTHIFNFTETYVMDKNNLPSLQTYEHITYISAVRRWYFKYVIHPYIKQGTFQDIHFSIQDIHVSWILSMWIMLYIIQYFKHNILAHNQQTFSTVIKTKQI